jgi:hypothetical protein
MATKTRQTKSKFLTVRLTPQEHKAFSVKTKVFGGPTFVLRELVNGFTEDRVTVTPNPEKRSIYHVT